MQRGVAEEHVDELPRILPDGLGREGNTDLEEIAFLFGDGLDAADDLRTHEIIGNRRKRHLDALLDRNGARTLLDGTRIAAHEINGLQTRAHGLHTHQRSLTGAPPTISMMRPRVAPAASFVTPPPPQ